MVVFINAILLAVYLTAIVIEECKGAGLVISGQVSILLLLLFVAAGSYGGRWLQGAIYHIDDEGLKTGARLSTFLWAGYATSLVFEPPTRLSSFVFLPLAIILISRYRPGLWKAKGVSPFLVGLSMAAQVASLALLTKVGGDFSAAFGIAALVWSVAITGARKFLEQRGGDGWGRSILLGQALVVAWAFINLSNQTISYSLTVSNVLLGIGVIGALAIVGAVFGPRREAGSIALLVTKIALALFGFSTLLNFNVTHLMETNLLTAFGTGGHFWFHVHSGLDVIYNEAKPFIDYTPAEGVIFQVYLPRILFEYLNFSMSGYLVSLFLLGVVSLALFLVITRRAFTEGVSLSPEFAFFLALSLVVTNNLPIHIYAGGPDIYWWVSLERMSALFVAYLSFYAYWQISIRIAAGEKGLEKILYVSGALTGAAHTFSILFEITFGIGGLIGLMAIFLIRPFSWRGIGVVFMGGAGLGVFYALLFDIPLANFFYHHPKSLLTFGRDIVDNYSSVKHSLIPGAAYIEQHTIFDSLARERILLTLHTLAILGAMALFLAAIPFGSRRSRHFPLASYAILTVFAIFFSRGQKFTGIFMGPYTNLIHMSMAMPLVPVAIAYTISSWNEAVGKESAKRGRLAAFVVAALIIVTMGVNGLHRGAKKSHPGWVPSVSFAHGHLLSRSLDEAFEHIFRHYSRKEMAKQPSPHEEFTTPYHDVKEVMVDLAQIRLISIKPPYKIDDHCYVCRDLFLLDIDDSAVYGETVIFRWSDIGATSYSLHVRTKDNPDMEGRYFDGNTTKTSIKASGLPADGREVFVAIVARIPSGRSIRSTYWLKSLPAK